MEIFTIAIDDNRGQEKYLVYRPLTGLAFVANSSMAQLAARVATDEYTQINGDVRSFLETIGFFRPDPPIPSPPTRSLSTAVLLLTNSCNLRCIYCYAAAGEKPLSVLDEDHGRTAIEYIAKQAIDNGFSSFTLAFHGGGEPTTAWILLQRLVIFARQQQLPVNVQLTSNAIWTDQQSDWILENIDLVSISMDGAPLTQDHQRPLVSGGSSSGIVMQNLQKLDRNKKKYGIRMTTTAPFDRLPDDVAFICQETACRVIQVEPAFNNTRGAHLPPNSEQAGLFVDSFLHAHRLAETQNCRLYYSGARPGVVTSNFCTSPYQALVVAPGGHIVACYEITEPTHPMYAMSRFGSVESGNVELNQESRNKLLEIFAKRRDGCRDCFCYWSCAGDCYTRAMGSGPNGYLWRSPRCTINQSITSALILEQIAKGNGVWAYLNMGKAPLG